MIEIVGQGIQRRPKAVMFDFDGTVGMVRAGWMTVMLDMMMETLGAFGDPAILRAEAEAYVARFTGKDTIHQMVPFVDHVRRLGGQSLTAESYKAEFLKRLDRLRHARLDALARGQVVPDSLLIPGVRCLLGELRALGLRLFLASGSPHEEIVPEAKQLGIAEYFEAIHGSGSLNKRELLESIVASGVSGHEIATFGDGTVEIEEAKRSGGIAIGVASDEPECLNIDEKKRLWLIAAGADYIIPNYLEPGLLNVLAEPQPA